VETDAIRATDAARRLGITTREMLALVHERRIGYVMVEGIAHIPEDALKRYQSSQPS